MRRFSNPLLVVCLHLAPSGLAIAQESGSAADEAALALAFALRREPVPAAIGASGVVGCATENIPAATLLVPYFQVSRNGTQGEDIPEGGSDTLVSFTNTTSTGLIVHVTVWNKYGKPVLGFNVPTAAFDVTFFRMKDILNGKLRVNPYTQTPARLPLDPCGQNRTTGVYEPRVGFGATTYSRFPNPSPGDAARSISIYDVPAFPSAQRRSGTRSTNRAAS